MVSVSGVHYTDLLTGVVGEVGCRQGIAECDEGGREIERERERKREKEIVKDGERDRGEIDTGTNPKSKDK